MSDSSLTQVVSPGRQQQQQQQQQPSTSRLLTPTTLPIPLLSSSVARRYSHAHTVLVVVYYYLRASALVADPLPTMTTDLVVVVLAQALFCAVCLPSAGAWVSGTSGGKILEGTAAPATKPKGAKGGSTAIKKKVGPSGGKTQSGGDGGSWRSRIMPTFFSLVLTLALPPVPLTLVALVLGAPLYPTSLLPLTLLLAVHVSLLALLPVFYSHGVSGPAWRDVAAAWLPFDEAGVWAGAVGCLVGGWVGAVPMALDWDRDWQKWPCTVLWGCVAGWAAGRLLTNVARFGLGKRIDLSENEEEPEVELLLASDSTPFKRPSDEKKSD